MPTYARLGSGVVLATSLIAWATRTTSRSRPAGQHLAAHLGLESGDDAEQVGVAAPLAVAVGGALDVGDARLDRGQRVGDRAGGVVVAVDAEPGTAGGEHAADRRRRAGSAACRRWCRTARRPRRRPRPRRAPPRARTRARRRSRRRSARRRGRPAGPRRRDGRRCRGSSPGSRRRWCAARARHGADRSSRPGTPPRSRPRAGRPPAGRRRRSRPARRVDPNAASVAVRSASSVLARAKNSASLGLDPGQPPSMKPTPRSSRWRATVSLSATESDSPSCCVPSRRVVS